MTRLAGMRVSAAVEIAASRRLHGEVGPSKLSLALRDGKKGRDLEVAVFRSGFRAQGPTAAQPDYSAMVSIPVAEVLLALDRLGLATGVDVSEEAWRVDELQAEVLMLRAQLAAIVRIVEGEEVAS